ncbi:MAG: hypothetical protein JST70_07985 [Bacteroidetes bacterium]|nr:hypothetical protein [Bacteroidota bacterium]
MALVKEKYSESGINRIYQLLKNEADSGIAKDYDIKVDELKVVGRNSDPDRFFEHEQFMVSETKSITVNIYDGASPRCTRYTLLLRDELPTRQELSGIEKTISTRMLQEKKVWEHDQLKKENVELRHELEQERKYSGKLEQAITELKTEKQKMPGKLTDAIISLAGIYLSANPKVLAKVPMLGGLLGTSQTDENSNDTVSEEEETECAVAETTEATFSKVAELKYTGQPTEKDFDRLENALIPLFPERYRNTVATVVSCMYHDNQIIEQVAELLEDNNVQDGERKAA